MMTERERAAATRNHHIRATFYMPLVLYVYVKAWLRGWKIDNSRTVKNHLHGEGVFVKNGVKYYRFGGTTWRIGTVDKTRQ